MRFCFLIALLVGGVYAAAFPEKIDISTLSTMTNSEAISWIQQNQNNPALEGAKNTVRTAFERHIFIYDELRRSDISPSLGVFAKMHFYESLFVSHDTYVKDLCDTLETDTLQKLTIIPSGLKLNDYNRLSRSFTSAQSLEQLALYSSSTLNSSFVSQVLAPLIIATKSLKQLHCQIRDHDLFPLALALQQNKTLEKFVRDGHGGPSQQSIDTLQSANEIYCPTPGMKSVIDALKDNPVFTHLHFDCWVDRQTILSLGDLISRDRLKTLHLPFWHVTEMAESLKKGTSLERLSLEHYTHYSILSFWRYTATIPTESAETFIQRFTDALRGHQNLSHLSFYSNPISNCEREIKSKLHRLRDVKDVF